MARRGRQGPAALLMVWGLGAPGHWATALTGKLGCHPDNPRAPSEQPAAETAPAFRHRGPHTPVPGTKQAPHTQRHSSSGPTLCSPKTACPPHGPLSTLPLPQPLPSTAQASRVAEHPLPARPSLNQPPSTEPVGSGSPVSIQQDRTWKRPTQLGLEDHWALESSRTLTKALGKTPRARCLCAA